MSDSHKGQVTSTEVKWIMYPEWADWRRNKASLKLYLQ